MKLRHSYFVLFVTRWSQYGIKLLSFSQTKSSYPPEG